MKKIKIYKKKNKSGDKNKRLNSTSIKTKLIVTFTILILLSNMGIGFISIYKSSQAIIYEAEQRLVKMAEDAAKITEREIDIQRKIIEMLSIREDIQEMNWDIQKIVLQQQLGRTEFLDLAVVTPDGTARYLDDVTRQLGNTEYVKKALEGSIWVSNLINNVAVTYAAPIIKDGIKLS